MNPKKKAVGRPKKPKHLKKVYLGVVIEPEVMIQLQRELKEPPNMSEVVERVLKRGLTLGV